MTPEASSPPATDPADAIKPIGRPNLTREVVNAIARLIMERVWRPGDSIPSEKELAARFRVGRSTIREAIQSLVTMGVVAIRPGEGSFIREPTSELLSDAFLWGLLLSPRNVGDFTSFRICVETTCAAAAARARSAATTEQLFTLLQRMKTDQNDDQRFKDHDYRFHVTIAEATGNPIFVKVVATLQSTVRLWFPITSPLTGNADDTHAEHRAIAEAIAEGKEQEAQDTMRRHLLNAAERLTLLLERKGG
jgi:GntR family transcriptional repressor for pyruvate dehydrogenase complex